jgi:prepilin signal peptidase PulO-like enzyme (type II secretory pathway)
MRRRRMLVLTLAAGVILTAVGFFLTGPKSGPQMPFAPLLFIVGLVLLFGSAVVFELTGEPEARAEAETARRAGEAV